MWTCYGMYAVEDLWKEPWELAGRERSSRSVRALPPRLAIPGMFNSIESVPTASGTRKSTSATGK